MLELPPIPVLLAILVVIFFGIGLHEYAHCKMADLAGDPTPRIYGRVTLNLTKHFEPLGTLMILLTSLTGVGIGWGKPAPMNPNNMRNPRWDAFAATAAGPLSNLVQATFFAVLLRVAATTGALGSSQFLTALLVYGVAINLGLFLFNLIPLGPLDGHWLLGTFFPEPARQRWYWWNQRYGSGLLLALIVVGQLSRIPTIGLIIGPPHRALFHLLTGMHY